MIKIFNHWSHWQSHIIIFGLEPVLEPSCSGIEITLFGCGFQIVNTKVTNWLLNRFWDVPKDRLKKGLQ